MNNEELLKRVERETRYLIGDQAIQIMVLRAALELQAQHPQEQPKPDPIPSPPQPEQPEPDKKEPGEPSPEQRGNGRYQERIVAARGTSPRDPDSLP